mmetsp:Transcript_77622/g.180037  ORF Transcript_77622/g.180037 Transcript_77622/m.180037 type:complete len:209 (+) Transcript_77622:747-1373(+)
MTCWRDTRQQQDVSSATSIGGHHGTGRMTFAMTGLEDCSLILPGLSGSIQLMCPAFGAWTLMNSAWSFRSVPVCARSCATCATSSPALTQSPSLTRKYSKTRFVFGTTTAASMKPKLGSMNLPTMASSWPEIMCSWMMSPSCQYPWSSRTVPSLEARIAFSRPLSLSRKTAMVSSIVIWSPTLTFQPANSQSLCGSLFALVARFQAFC